MDKELRKLIEDLKSMEMAHDRYQELEAISKQKEKRLAQLTARIELNLKKQDQLGKTSLLGLYQSLNKERKSKHLEKTKEKYFKLVLEYQDLQKAMALIDFERKVLFEKLNNYDQVVFELKENIKYKQAIPDRQELKELKQVLLELEFKVMLIKEMEEAIKDGMAVNREINKAIRFLENDTHKDYYSKGGEFEEILLVGASDIGKYQEIIVKVKHKLVKFEAELHDVYNHIFKNKEITTKIGESFLAEYKECLITDWVQKASLANSYNLMHSMKATVLGLTRTLRKDLKGHKKDLAQLEEVEEELMNKIK